MSNGSLFSEPRGSVSANLQPTSPTCNRYAQMTNLRIRFQGNPHGSLADTRKPQKIPGNLRYVDSVVQNAPKRPVWSSGSFIVFGVQGLGCLEFVRTVHTLMSKHRTIRKSRVSVGLRLLPKGQIVNLRTFHTLMSKHRSIGIWNGAWGLPFSSANGSHSNVKVMSHWQKGDP